MIKQKGNSVPRGPSRECTTALNQKPPETGEEQERPEEYCWGGYHPVKLGDMLQERYQIIRKLGWGYFSTVWLSWDPVEKRYVALKIVKSEKIYTETAEDEIKILKAIRDADPGDPKRNKIIQLFDDFRITGVNGTHVCMVFEVLGYELLELIAKSNYRGIPLPNVKSIVRQVLEGLDYLHSKCHVIHTDIKPENILVCVDDEYFRNLVVDPSKLREELCPTTEDTDEHQTDVESIALQIGELQIGSTGGPSVQNKTEHGNGDMAKSANVEPCTTSSTDDLSKNIPHSSNEYAPLSQSTNNSSSKDPALTVCDIQVKIADLGNACWIDKHFTEDIQTREFRSLEVIIESGYNTSTDIWSVACMAFELATGEHLFDSVDSGRDSGSEDSDDDGCDDVHIASMIELLGPIPKKIALSGAKSKDIFNAKGKLRSFKDIKPWSLSDMLQEKYGWDQQDAEDFGDFLRPMLEYDAKERATAAICLDHPWLQDFER
ncbi:SRSF protein kinase 2-like [Aedes aegypti]|uniref:non-specific serine/threonine protein kinase n=1 Tax=Aedes aegypti TaxID=7159 RepID=A0A6I8U465_AEDAE|nr:SRSF protein kinase 2-like [Aedes aegypti]